MRIETTVLRRAIEAYLPVSVSALVGKQRNSSFKQLLWNIGTHLPEYIVSCHSSITKCGRKFSVSEELAASLFRLEK
jgi:hypothetical protein